VGKLINRDEDHLAEEEYSPVQFISQLRGQFNAQGASPLLALAFAIVLFSMAGIPPLVGFFAKQAVLLAAVKNGFIFLALVGIITSVISAAYYLRVIKVMIFEQPEQSKFDNLNLTNNNSINNEFDSLSNTIKAKMSNSLSFSISILTVLILFFVFIPTLILNSAHIMALSLFYL
ncbi:hypothetical protein EXT64_23080, partial [Pectobacterium atrosepticum]